LLLAWDSVVNWLTDQVVTPVTIATATKRPARRLGRIWMVLGRVAEVFTEGSLCGSDKVSVSLDALSAFTVRRWSVSGLSSVLRRARRLDEAPAETTPQEHAHTLRGGRL
jgi:hypothetical protein